jgi:hypothetical protein
MCMRLALAVLVTLLSPIVEGAVIANSSGPQESSEKIEVRLVQEKSVIRSGETLKLQVEIWNVGTNDVIIAQNIDEPYWNAVLELSLEVGSQLHGPAAGMAADAIPESNPDLAKTFIDNWLTLRRNHCYGTFVYMDPMDFPQLRKPGHYRVRARYSSRGISSIGAWNAARLNQEDIDKLPFKPWNGTVESNFVGIQVRPQMKRSPTKK